MKKQIILIAMSTLLGVITFTSCKKGCTNELADNYNEKAKKDDGSCVFTDDEAPKITINKPTPGMYMIDSLGILMMPISFDVDIEDNEGLKSISYELLYINKNDSILMSVFQDLNGEKIAKIDTSYKNTEAIYPLTIDHQNHNLIITAEDEAGNIKKDTASFFIHYMG